MSYITIIAEKPSVAKEIAKSVGADSAHRDGPCGYLEGNGYRVTWAFGHLVGLKTPEEMGYEKGTLPMLPEEWPTKVLGRKGKDGKVAADPMVNKQMKTLEMLFNGSDRIIVATDAGREGELIFRYIYEYLGCRKPFQRLWISSLTAQAIREGLQSLKPGREYDGLSAAAHLRSQADWLVGYNASKALRIATGYRELLSLGRVQTPTLGLICERYLENKNFKPTPFWKIKVKGTKSTGETVEALSEKDYKTEAEAACDASRTDAGGILTVTTIEKKRVTSKPPLLFDLTALQRAANSRFGLTADQTLKAAQSLYEKKHLTYPRTGSCYIPDDVFATVPRLIAAVGNGYGKFRNAAEALKGIRLCRKSVDASKVTDHHALLPTDNIPGALEGHEKIVWELVVGRMLEAFGEDSLSDVTTITFDGNGVTYKARGSVLVKAGWKSVWGTEVKEKKDKKDDDGEDDSQELPELREGERLKAANAQVERRTDKPKPIYTDSSLLAEMETCGKRIEDDEDAREAMKDIGLGTPATRAATIEILVLRKYIVREGKKILPTPLGLQVWDMVKGRLVADVKTTGEWERDLTLVERGQMSPERFDSNIRKHTEQIVQDLLTNCKQIVETADMVEPVRKCPLCGKPMKNMKFTVSCDIESGGCGMRISREIAGKRIPAAAINDLCSKGKTSLIKGFITKTGKKFDAMLKVDPERKGLAFEFQEKPSGPEMTGRKCPNCGKTLKDGSAFLSCECGFTAWKTIAGTPISGENMDKLLSGQSIYLTNLVSKKTHKKYSALITMDTKTGKTMMSFDKK